MKRTAAAVFALALVALDRSAEAADKPPRLKQWYGYQTLVADSIALGCFVGALATKHDNLQAVLLLTSLTSYVVAPGVIHGIHDRPWVGVADSGVRALGPLIAGGVGAGIGLAFSNRSSDVGAAAGGVLGVVAGIVSAIVIDASLLSYETVAPDGPVSKPAPRFAPLFVATSTQVGAGVGGSF